MTSSIRIKGTDSKTSLVVIVIENAAVRIDFLQRCLFFVPSVFVCLCVFASSENLRVSPQNFVSTSISFRRPIVCDACSPLHLEEGLKELVPRATHRKNVITKMTVFKVQRGRPCRCSEGASQEESDVDSVTTV
jgi:hypothetical protein